MNKKMVRKENKKNNKNLNKKKVEKDTKVKKDKQFWMSMVILVLMITSIAGFALMMTVGAPKENNSGQDIPKDYPLQSIEYQWQTFWVVIRNYEQFVFPEIDSFQNDSNAKMIANSILEKEKINIYSDNESDLSAVYLLEKLMRALGKEYSFINEPSCSSNDLYISTTDIKGDCVKFIFPKEEQYQEANAVVYYALS